MSLNNSANGASPAPDDNVRYDLAGNPLPPLPAAAPPAGAYPPPILPAASAPPRFAPPPGAVPPSFQPPPGAAAPAWGGTAAPAPRSAAGPVLYIGLGVAAVVLLGLIFGLRAMKPVLVTAPTSYQTYTALDSSFSCDRPAGWKMQEAGSQGGSLSWVSFEIGHARVKVVSDAAGSLLSESTNAANANLPPEQQTPPVAKLHEADKSQLANSLTDYQEGLAQRVTLTGGDARVSEWTATDNGKLHGYRVTMLNKEREITVICLSPERNWAVLQPAFQRIINSVTPGNG